MKNTDWKGPCRWLIPLVLLGLIVAGCAAKEPKPKDGFFDKWTTLAEESKGHSPASREKPMDVPDAARKGYALEEGGGAGPGKALSNARITMRMRNADIKAIIRALSRAVNQNILIRNDIKGEITVDVVNTPWSEVFESTLRSKGLTYTWDGSIIRVMAPEDRKTEPLIAQSIRIHFADVDKLKDSLQDLLTKDEKDKARGSIKVDAYSRSLVINGTREDLTRIIAMVEKLDRPTKQILIKANIVEATKETARNLGVRWGGMYSGSAGGSNYYVTPGGTLTTLPPNPMGGNYTPTYGSAGISGQGFGVNFPIGSTAMTTAGGAGSLGLMFGTLGGSILEFQLQALQTEGVLNILSSPSITTMDNQMAFTENGEKVPYVSTTSTSTGTTQDVRFVDAVLRLEITPYVIDEKSIKMKIMVKKDEVDATRNVLGNPYIFKKQTETTLIVQDGETIVISGLTKNTTSNSESGIPWLMDIPGLGWLFKGESRDNKLQEVLVFITPHMLRQAAGLQPAKAPAQPNLEKPPEKKPGQ
jgi:type IV pilus assembly protein PilQ